MANGIGKIALGRKKAQTSWAQGTSRSPQLSYRIGTKKRQRDAAYRNTILSSLGSIASGFKENTDSWGKYEAGAEAAGVDVGEASFGDKLLRGFGIKNVDLAKKHDTSEGSMAYSGAELMNIGEKKQTGTLESFLGEKKIGDLYGGESKGYQAFTQFGKEGQDWQGFRDKELLGKGVPQVAKGALGVNIDVGSQEGILSDKDLMATIGTPSGMINEGDTYKSLVADTYGRTSEGKEGNVREISQEQWDKQAMQEQFPRQPGTEHERFTDPSGYGIGPKDQLAAERQRYQEGIVAREADEVMGGDPESWGGNFEQGSNVEDMWAKDENIASPHTAPGGFAYDDPQPDDAGDVPLAGTTGHFQQQLTSDADPGYKMDADELATIQPEAQGMSSDYMASQSREAAGQPTDPMAQQRLNAERQQLGQKDAMSFEQILKEQDRLANLLNPKE